MASDDVIGGSGKTRDEDGEQVPDRAVAARFSPEEEKVWIELYFSVICASDSFCRSDQGLS